MRRKIGGNDISMYAGESESRDSPTPAQGLGCIPHNMPQLPPDMPENPSPDPAPQAHAGQDLEALWTSAYGELRRLAQSRLRASGPITLLDTAGLVSDTYQRLRNQHGLVIESRSHFLAYCARVMRSVIIDMIRERQAERRGAGATRVTLNTAIGEAVASQEDPLWVDDALQELAKQEPRLAQVVEMRYFGGYQESEIAEALGVTVRTVQRDWQKARVLLRSMMLDEKP